jgi:hypothetical protein
MEEKQIATANQDECLELKNIKYKTMLQCGNKTFHETKSENDMSNLDSFLENEKNSNKNEPWCKLDKTIKIQKIQDFVMFYKNENKLDDEETTLLFNYLKDCIDRKKLARVKDVIYDKENGVIKDIPGLTYTKSNKHFTLKCIDKNRVSTLKSLAPKKGQGTVKNKAVLATPKTYSSDEDN